MENKMDNNVESRNQTQEMAMQIMYGFLIQQETNQVINVEETISEVSGKPYEECDLFLKELLIESLKNEKEIIDYISTFLNKWKFERLNYCIQAILIIAVSNYFYCKLDRKSTRLNSSHQIISYAVFCLKKKK